MSNLDKAREWAESLAAGPATDRAHAAAEIIQSLPDAWVGAEEVLEIADDLESLAQESVLKNRFVEQARRLRNLIAPALPNPEDVPPNEPWLIEVGGQKAIGTRDEDDEVVPWSVAALDGSFVVEYHDSVVTLIHKLVSETHTLPEGMRLADHEQYGRVITSPKPNRNGVYDLLVPRPKFETGADWEYAHECELTFLDGEE